MSDYLSHEEAQQWETWINEIDWNALNASDLDDAAAATAVSSKERQFEGAPKISVPSNCLASDEPPAVGNGQKRDLLGALYTSSSSEKVAKLALKCTEKHCTYSRAFTGRYELDRHVATVHKKRKTFWCPVKGCFKGVAPPSFARSDKLTSHIRSTHGFDRETRCPMTGCATALPLDLLGRHIEFGHHWTRTTSMSDSDRYCAALIHAADTNSQKCPYWPCSKKLRLKDLCQHLQSHSVAELQYMVAELRTGGYMFTLPSQPDEFAKIWVVCPVCHDFSEGHEDFAKHLVTCHLVDREKWQAAEGVDEKHLIHTILNGCIDTRTTKDCPLCKERIYSNVQSHPRHHCRFMDAMLRAKADIVAELRPHRQALLRLCPNFANIRIIFEDLASTQA